MNKAQPSPTFAVSNTDTSVSALTWVAVKQTTFVKRHEATWQQFDALCHTLGISFEGQNPVKPLENSQDGLQGDAQNALVNANNSLSKSQNLPQKKPRLLAKSNVSGYPLILLYRQICQHYALAKQRHYSPQLVAQLHQRVMVGHQLIYQGKSSYIDKFLGFLFYGFPMRVRQHKTLFWLAFFLFYAPFFGMLIGCYLNDGLIYSVMSPDQVASMEYMYNPANEMVGRDADRMSDTDMMMFGYYIQHNIGIDFQMYATGLFAGIGTILSTLYNGVAIGAVAGHLTQLGYSSTFWSFVCGHSAFELTGAVIASMAGFRLSQAIVAPYPYRRRDAFVVAGKESIELLLGAAFMTFLAAFVEAFWSSSNVIPNAVKYAVALVLWMLVTSYLIFAGRGRAHDEFR